MKGNGRKAHRAPVSLEVLYRTTGSFLVSYSINLSKGGLFLETDQLVSVGTQLAVHFSVPAWPNPIETNARVVWVRTNENPEGLPAGLGLQFERLDDNIGTIIDDLVQGFAGIRLLAVAKDDNGVERLSRYLRSIMHCEIIPCTSPETFTAGLHGHLDLVLVDLDSVGSTGIAIISLAASQAPPIAVVALTRSERRAQQAEEEGATKVLKNPPDFADLRQTVLNALGRPWQMTKP